MARADANGASPNGDLETLVDLAGEIRPELVIGIYQWCAERGAAPRQATFLAAHALRIPDEESCRPFRREVVHHP